MTLGYEHLRDTRVADRGVTSFAGRPADVRTVHLLWRSGKQPRQGASQHWLRAVEHRFARATIRNRTMVGGYDRFYQNFVPGAATPDRSQVALTVYNNATNRTNIFNQTDLTFLASTGRVRHTLMGGVEVGGQATDNFRQTGFFNNAATSLLVPFDDPTISTPVTFRQNATDADNHVGADRRRPPIVQDQVELSRYLQLIGGLRVDRFDLQYHNKEPATRSAAPTISSRRGPASSSSRSPRYRSTAATASRICPSSGDQFSSLTVVTQQLKPEQFTNYEVGVKWDVVAAAFGHDGCVPAGSDQHARDRSERSGADRPDRQPAHQGLRGRRERADHGCVEGGRRLRAPGRIRHERHGGGPAGRTGRPGAASHLFVVEPLPVPAATRGRGLASSTEATCSRPSTIRSRCQVTPAQTPRVYVTLTKGLRLQANVENVLDERYFVNADSNTNISPGIPRALRVALTARF